MRIYSMTATFGKLEHETLTLKPGMNVIHAPNEWGKSTWCAFLIAMLYGLDTRTKTTRAALADKEHFAPWSGSPMSGRMDLCWQGRDITIERTTHGRIPMGVFRAYETESGLPVPELTANNCGQMLLGIEQSVFRRAGFIRLSDLPVTQDDALRSRLNALVTTGDESGDGIRLEKGLRELKNRCRYNRTGLLPQAEQERDTLEAQLAELETLSVQRKRLESRLAETAGMQRQLENHAAALAYDTAILDAQRVAEAEEQWDKAQQKLEALEYECASLPGADEARAQCRRIRELSDEIRHMNFRRQNLPIPPQAPAVPTPFLGMTPEQAVERVQQDRAETVHLGSPWWIVLLTVGLLALAGAGYLIWKQLSLYAVVCSGIGLLCVIAALALHAVQQRGLQEIFRRYGSANPEKWEQLAQDYRRSAEEYRRMEAQYRTARAEVDAGVQRLSQKHAALCGKQSVDQALEKWQSILRTREALELARREAEQAQHQYKTLQAMAKPIPDAPEQDELHWSAEQTQGLLRNTEEEMQHLRTRLGEYRGRMEVLGDAENIRRKAADMNIRVEALTDFSAALALAQDTLEEASAELQRRFAPRITRQAQGMLSRLTSGRYDRLSIGTDLSVQTAADREDVLHDALWRSEGTVDQLYLSLRLAVAEELTPEAPLILDDALVRFDDARMKSALDILTSLSESRQVILFTCQEREEKALADGEAQGFSC